MTTIVQSAMTAAVPVPDLSGVETQLAVQNLRSVINNNSAYIRAVDGIADEFADETGVAPLIIYSADVIPAMTSNSAPSGTASASSENTTAQQAWKAFNNTTGDLWIASSAGSGWLKYDFGSGVTKTPIAVTIQASSSPTGAPASGTIQASNDGSTWTTLKTLSGLSWSANEIKTFTFSNTTAYRYFFFYIVPASGGPSIQEIEILEAGSGLVSVNTTYEATGDYYHNPPGGSLSVITNVVGASYSHSSIYASGYTSEFAFDDDLTKRWAASSNNTGWVQIDLGAGNEKTLVKIIPHATGGGDGQCIDGFTFLGSNDGSNFTTLYTMANGQGTTEFGSGTALTSATFDFTNTTAYRYYRFNITQTGTSSSRSLATVYELYGYEAVTTPASMTLVSDTFTAETAPTESSAVFLHQPVDAVTLNTDILGYISRDAGTTWTQGTLVDAGSFDSTTNILTMNAVDISGQPSGTSMKYKIVTANAKEQRLHGAWLAWS